MTDREMLERVFSDLDDYVEAAGEDAHSGPFSVRGLVRKHLQEGD